MLQNGKIADPPIEITAGANLEYARPTRCSSPRRASSLSSPLASPSDENLFCTTCLKNQYLLTTALASYLPAPTDKEYAAYEAKYPEYRRNLEQRYPPVCVECEPRARRRIREAGYVAKTDHLRRMMERTRGANPGRSWWDCGWRGVLVFLGGLAWWSSILGQGSWHVYGMMGGSSLAQVIAEDKDHSFMGYLQHALVVMFRHQESQLDTLHLVRWTVILGVFSFWWNNRLMGKLSRSGSRMTGLNEYYRLQGVIILIRTLAWWVLQTGFGKRLGSVELKGAHAFMFIFVVLVSQEQIAEGNYADRP